MKVQRAALRAPRGQMLGGGDVDVHRRGPPTTQMAPRRRNPKGTEPSNHCRALMPVRNGSVHSARSAAWVLLGSAIVRLAKVARPRMRAIQALLCFSYSRSRARDDPHRDRLRRAGRLSGLPLPVARPRIRALRTTECRDNHSVGVRYASSPHFHSPIWKFARSGTLRVNTHARDPLYFHHGLLTDARRRPPARSPRPHDRASGRDTRRLRFRVPLRG